MRRLRYAARPRVIKRAAGELPHIDLGDVESGGSGRWVPREDVERDTEALTAHPGDVVLGKLRPYLRKGFVADRELTCSTEFLVLRPAFGWDARYLLYLLLSKDFTAYAETTVEGTKMPRASWESLRDYPLSDRSAERQAETADFLDRECAWIDRLRHELTSTGEVAAAAHADLLRRLVLEGGYPLVPLKHYAQRGTGHTPSRERAEYWIQDDRVVPWFTLADVHQIRSGRRESVTETAEQITEVGIANSSAVRLPAGTVLLSRTASVGFSAVMGVEMAVSQDFMTWTCGPSLDPHYLLIALRAMQPEIRRLMYGSTHKTIYMPDLHALRIPLPELARQQEIVAQVRTRSESLWSFVDEIAALQSGLLEYRDALITEAVTGQLDVDELSESLMEESLAAVREGERPEVVFP